MLEYLLIGGLITIGGLYAVLQFTHVQREGRELQILTILGVRHLSTAELIDELLTSHLETKSAAWPVPPVLRRLQQKGCIRCMNPRSAHVPPRWVIADAGKSRIAARAKKDA